MNEIDATVRLSKYLDKRAYSFFVDSGYNSDRIDHLESNLENCGLNSTMTIEGRIPDIIGTTPQNRLFAIEVKGTKDIRKGIGQAAYYRQGVHESYLAAKADAVEEFEDTALSCGLGIIPIDQDPNVPIDIRDPIKNVGATKLERTLRALAVKTSRFESAHTTFPSMSRPENAFFPLLAIQEKSSNGSLDLSVCKEAIKENPDGYSQANAAISLGRTLRLVEKPQRDQVRMTDSGRACYYLIKGLADEHPEDTIYRYVSELKRNRILHKAHPEITAFLRDRYLAVPDVRLLTHVLASYDGTQAELSRILAEIALASPDTFLNLFCGRGMEEDFRELVEDRQISAEEESFRESILGLTSSNSLYNFVYQIRTIGLLAEESDAVHQSKDLEIGKFTWTWEPGRVGRTGDLLRE